MLISALAVGGTGAAVAAGLGVSSGHQQPATVAAYTVSDAGTTTGTTTGTTAHGAADRPLALSRSFDRAAAEPAKTDPAKKASLDAVTSSDDTATTGSEDIADQDPHTIAAALLPSFGWDGSQYGCLVSLWDRESGWNVHAANPSGAYGIPQSLPGSKMASAGPDWQDNAETQIKWGLGYIAERYGSPCGAWGHSQATGWY